MYWYNELTISMNNKKAATAAMAVAKNVLTTTSIEEYCEGEFAGFADSLLVKKNEVLCDGDGAVWYEAYELILPEILKAIAAQGNEFHGRSLWNSTYDSEYWEFSFDGKELVITSNFHRIDDEPVCQECDAEATYCYDEEEDCYVCPECGHTITVEEFEAACETTKVQKFTF